MMRIRRGTLKALGTSTTLALKVSSAARPDMIRSVAASTAEAVRREFPRLNYVSEPLPTPASAVVVIDAKDLPSGRVKDVLERFRTLLEEFGLTEGEISASNEDGPFDFRTFDQSMLSASLVAVPRFRAPWLRYDAVMPEQWVRAAASWLTESEPSSATLRFGWLEPTTVPSQDVGDLIATATGEGRLSGSLQAFAGDEGSLFRALNIRREGLVAAIGGAEFSNGDLDAMGAGLKRLGLALEHVTWAAVVFDEDWKVFKRLSPTVWNTQDFDLGVFEFCDELLPDVWHWQLLSEGHRSRLEQVEAGYVAVGPTHWSIEIGSPADWLPDSSAQVALQGRARVQLSPLLLPRSDKRYGRQRMADYVEVRRANGL